MDRLPHFPLQLSNWPAWNGQHRCGGWRLSAFSHQGPPTRLCSVASVIQRVLHKLPISAVCCMMLRNNDPSP